MTAGSRIDKTLGIAVLTLLAIFALFEVTSLDTTL